MSTQRGSTANLVGFGTFNGSMTKPRKTVEHVEQWQWQQKKSEERTWFIWTPTVADMYGTNKWGLSVM